MAVEDQKLYQVVFVAGDGGHGEQVLADSEEEVREKMAAQYGEDYAIASIIELPR